MANFHSWRRNLSKGLNNTAQHDARLTLKIEIWAWWDALSEIRSCDPKDYWKIYHFHHEPMEEEKCNNKSFGSNFIPPKLSIKIHVFFDTRQKMNTHHQGIYHYRYGPGI